MAKKSRRKRAKDRRNPMTETQAATAPPPQAVAPQPEAKAPRAETIVAPKAQAPVVRNEGSHNLGLELRMIALLGGTAIIILIGLTFADPTSFVARLLHL